MSALDTLRAMATRPACDEVLLDELAQEVAGFDPGWIFVTSVKLRPGDLDTIVIEPARLPLPGVAGIVVGAPRTSRRRRVSVSGHSARRPVGRSVRQSCRLVCVACAGKGAERSLIYTRSGWSIFDT